MKWRWLRIAEWQNRPSEASEASRKEFDLFSPNFADSISVWVLLALSHSLHLVLSFTSLHSIAIGTFSTTIIPSAHSSAVTLEAPLQPISTATAERSASETSTRGRGGRSRRGRGATVHHQHERQIGSTSASTALENGHQPGNEAESANPRGRGAQTHRGQARASAQANGDGHSSRGRGARRGRSNRGGRGGTNSQGSTPAGTAPASVASSDDGAHEIYGNTRSTQAHTRNPQQSHQNSRRSKFHAGLTETNNSLCGSAASFTPQNGKNQNLIPAPATQTLLERLTLELTNASHDCTICFNAVSRTTAIYSCAVCCTPFHLSCIKEWATRSVADTAERAKLLATRNGAETDPSKLLGNWRCPSCATTFGPADIPKRYKCFCGRVNDPPHKQGTTPHSCNKLCAKIRPIGCVHPSCGLLCHPGPCPPCPVVLSLPCHCGKQNLQVRCSAINSTAGAVQTALQSNLLSCNQTCEKLLGCGLHRCENPCHEGDCGSCTVVRDKRCYCGRHVVTEACGEGFQSERKYCFRPNNEEKNEWTGEFECAELCSLPFDCGNHSCQLNCHAHTSPTVPNCPFAPSSVKTCPCGQTSLSQLTNSPRTSCLDPIPTCRLNCAKILACGHACDRPCHTGDCGSCQTLLSIVCRCGSTKSTRACGQRKSDGSPLDEFMCARVCRVMRACGRHPCNRICCPLNFQEALVAKKGKGRRNFEQFEAEDPLGLHACDKICGRKLNCGKHSCERADHKGPCPPCLQAGFEELVCHCGSTVVLPPIPCSFQIDCRHPCIRPSACGHQTMAHACHEDPTPCPPCPYLMEKRCACGKKLIGNVRCSLDASKVSCGQPCGKLLRCGGHRCRKLCHVTGECETCDQICLKPRKLCSHPCPLPCHSPTSCSVEIPCQKLIQVTCSCGHLKQNVKCAACTAKPEGNLGRLLKCSSACLTAKRNQNLADALGIENREIKFKQVEYEPQIWAFYAANMAWCDAIESQLHEFVKGEKTSHLFPVMKRPQRVFLHELTDYFDLRSESLDEEPNRSVNIHRTPTTTIPTPNLAEAYKLYRKTASQMLSFGPVKKLQPAGRAVNSLFLEGVLGLDENMLREILHPILKPITFQLQWTGEEDVLVSFPHAPSDLNSRLPALQNSLRNLAAETGFCAMVESVCVSTDGKITRGAWTPVVSNSSSRAGAKNLSAGNVFTANSFGALGGGTNTSNLSSSTAAWGSVVAATAGSVLGPGHHKAPRAVYGTISGTERADPPPLQMNLPEAEREQDVPESWEDDEVQPQADIVVAP